MGAITYTDNVTSLGTSGGINYYDLSGGGGSAYSRYSWMAGEQDNINFIHENSVDVNPQLDWSSSSNTLAFQNSAPAAPTWMVATSGVSAHYSFDTGDRISITNADSVGTYEWMGKTSGVWRSYHKAGASEWVDGVSESFDETLWYTVDGNNYTNGTGVAMRMDRFTTYSSTLSASVISNHHAVLMSGMNPETGSLYGYGRTGYDYTNRNEAWWKAQDVYYSFNQAIPNGAGNVQDVSGSGNHGVNTTPYIVQGGTTGNGAGSWAASGEYVNAGDILDGTSNFCVSVWLKLNALGNLMTIWAKGTGATTVTLVALSTGGFGDNNDLFVSARNGGNQYGYTTGDFVTTGVWHHVFYKFQGSGATDADRLQIWWDGSKKSMTFGAAIGTTINDNAIIMALGVGSVATFTDLNGYESGFRLWTGNGADKNISTNQIIEIYNAGYTQ